MKKALKWTGIGVLAFCLVIIAALLLIPMFVDVQDYKPRLEALVTEKTGRDFAIGGDIELSLFPWAGISFADLRLGNPDGYEEKTFLSIESFDVSIKLMPLFSKNIEVKRFVIEGPELVLEKSAEGKVNWQGLAGSRKTAEKGPDTAGDKRASAGLPIKTLEVGECAVKDGSVKWIDNKAGIRKTLSSLNLELQDVSFDNPIGIFLSATLDGSPLSAEGTVGPLGQGPGKNPVAFDLALKAFNQLKLALKGKITDLAGAPGVETSFNLAPFSPRKLLKTVSIPFPVETTDPGALNRLDAKGSLKGSAENVSITNGLMNLDDSLVSFSLEAAQFQKPDLSFTMEVDTLDLDRYMPPAKDEESKGASGPKETGADSGLDYAPLRKPAIDGTVLIKELSVRKAGISDLKIKISAGKGLYNIDPIAFKAYEGTLKAGAVLNVQEDTPSSSVKMNAQGVKINPALKDFLDKDFLEGTLAAQMSVAFSGDKPGIIKKTLNGSGELVFKDGAVLGIDLAGMVRNVTSAFGLSDKPAEKPRTDFSELNAPFTIKNGVVNTTGTTMKSPLLRLMATGDANLIDETLDMRVVPKVVATLKGQGDTEQRSGVVVPILISGTFSEPKFRPDVKGILKQGIEIPKTEDLKKILPGTNGTSKESLKDSAKELLKSLPFGNK